MTPHEVSIVHVERQDRVAGVSGDRPVAVAGPDVDEPTFGVDRRRVPHTGARWAPERTAGRVVTEAPDRFANAVHLPQQLPGIRVERGDAATRSAALVVGVRA